MYVASRNREKALAAIQELEEETQKKANFLQLDLADLESVKAAAEEFLRFVPTLFANPFLMFLQQRGQATCVVQQRVSLYITFEPKPTSLDDLCFFSKRSYGVSY